MKSITVASPDRSNWKLFCQEPALTESEQTIWVQMAQLHRQDDAFASFCDIETSEAWATAKTNSLLPRTKDWSDLVFWADASRALKRAEIKAYQKWLNEIKERS